jgi:serine/threonine-protein kinase HipA
MATIQLHDSKLGWLDAATVKFGTDGLVQFEYDIDYAQQYWGRKDLFALSVTRPVNLDIYKGEVPAFIMDLIPQGQVLKRLLVHYRIAREYDYKNILETVPLAPPGNLRIKEPWLEVEDQRASYRHPGFSKKEICEKHVDFVQYMMEHGSPIAGTSGAAGGAPKFLLRQDSKGNFHADGFLDDNQTKKAWLIKFPFTDSSNAKQILRSEWGYSQVMAAMGLDVYESIEWQQDVLFIPRFDRVLDHSGCLHYLGLESFYSSHNISQFGARLTHESNLSLIHKYSSEPLKDIIEYLKRDLLNQALANTDNHGRNFSFLKRDGAVRLSPSYDVAAMKFFQGDMILPLTSWAEVGGDFKSRLNWIESNLNLLAAPITEEIRKFRDRMEDLFGHIHNFDVPKEIAKQTAADREDVLRLLKSI